MNEFMSYDPYRGIKTRNNIEADLIISALAKIDPARAY